MPNSAPTLLQPLLTPQGHLRLVADADSDAALVSSKSALASNKLGYEVGVRINIDVLNAEQQVYATQRALAKARFDTLLAQLKLKAAVGALSEADLEAINPLFEAPAN